MSELKQAQSAGDSAGGELALMVEIERLRQQVVTTFIGDEVPTFRQGVPQHELEDVVTAAQCTALVADIVLLRQRVSELEAALKAGVGKPIGYFCDVNALIPEQGKRIEQVCESAKNDPDVFPLYTSPSIPLSDRERELIDGMIEVQLYHAAQCDRIANRTMAEKQKGWDMERVELLRKLLAAAPKPKDKK